MRLSLRSPGVAWVVLAAWLAAGAVVVHLAASPASAEWQPGRWMAEPWRWWTAAFVHLNRSHFQVNLAAVALLAAFGAAAGVPPRTTAAWALAWPLTHLGLLAMPALKHYGGLSGLLHAGAAAVAVFLLASGRGRERWVGGMALVLIAAKVLSETPWRSAVQVSPQWDFPVAAIAHLTGAVAGLVCSALAEAWARQPRIRDTRAVVE